MEYTQDLVVFDLLHVPIYHGWVVDPHDAATADAFGALTYNQVVEKVHSYALLSPRKHDCSANFLCVKGFCAPSRIVRESLEPC
jgi:hypothetical protein